MAREEAGIVWNNMLRVTEYKEIVAERGDWDISHVMEFEGSVQIV